MKNSHLKKKALALLSLMLWCGGTFAQNSFDLFMGMGTSRIDHYDLGTVPYHIYGAGSVQDWGASYAWNRCQIQLDGRYLNSTLINLEGAHKAIDLNFEFLYRYKESSDNRFRFYTGAALEGFGELKSIPELQNASTSASIFGNLCDVNMVQWDLCANKAQNHYWLTAYGKLTLPLVGYASRPGFSYINANMDMSVIDILFAGHESFAKFFPGCNTDFGLWLNLKNRNRIGLNYRWDYLSTGKKGIWRYDNSYHTLNLSFVFNIK